ncbi:MAG TPA: glycosyltransferase family 4 protein [Flavobacteriales bacterium]
MEAPSSRSAEEDARSVLRVAFASIQRANDIQAWSGTVYYVARALEHQGIVLDHVDELQQVRLLLNKAVNRLYRITGRQAPLPVERSKHMAARFAKEIASFVDKGKHDAVFSPSSIPLALLRTSVPKVFYTDATFADMLQQYPEFAEYPEAFIEEGHALEREALTNCDLAIYSSHWAAESAIHHYGAHKDKVRVVPFGSNLDLQPDRAEVFAAIAARPTDHCELLFLGVNWIRKGGPLALEVVRELNAAGVPATLTVVGCSPPPGTEAPFLKVLPFVDKSTPQGQRKLADLVLRSHFLLLPSLAECFGIVYAEASSMGVPSLARHVGGVADAVREGRNGHLFAPDASSGDYVERIKGLMNDRAAYERLAHAAFQEHREHLNWEVAGSSLHGHLLGLR